MVRNHTIIEQVYSTKSDEGGRMAIQSSGDLKRYNHLIGELEAIYHEASRKMGISDSISKILYTICNSGEHCLLIEICRQTGLSKQTVNSALRNLERDEIVCLRAVNGKSKDVWLTEKGKSFAEKTALRLIEIENSIFDSWAKEDVGKYLDLTNRFLIDLQERAKKI